jgi:hypothetical protein
MRAQPRRFDPQEPRDVKALCAPATPGMRLPSTSTSRISGSDRSCQAPRKTGGLFSTHAKTASLLSASSASWFRISRSLA